MHCTNAWNLGTEEVKDTVLRGMFFKERFICLRESESMQGQSGAKGEREPQAIPCQVRNSTTQGSVSQS